MEVQELLQPEIKKAPEGHIKTAVSLTAEDYMKDRVVYKIRVYDRLSRRQRTWYTLIGFLGILISSTVPVLINLEVTPLIPTILSLLVTIMVSSEKLFHFREHWRNYDSIAAALRSEQLLFQSRAGIYKRKDRDAEDAFQLFVKRVEDLIKEERADTIEMRTTESTAE